MRVNGKLIICAFLLVASTITVVLQGKSVSADQVTNRSLTLQAGVTDGGSKPGGSVKHLFAFKIATDHTIGSIKFQYCTTAAGTCTMPTGLITSTATLTGETGVTGFTMVNTTNGTPYLTRAAAAVTLNPDVTYQFSNVTNPTTTNTTFYVRITTHASTDGTGATSDFGTVAASTATQIVLTGIMPESLIFCAGATIGVNGSNIPDCSTASAGAVSFNQLFSPTDTATATSQMAASTNATGGYTISVNGDTLRSGGNPIAGMSAQAAGARGVSQFGLNLKLNTTLTATPAFGAEISLASNGTDLRGAAATGYETVDNFKFVTGDTVAQSTVATNAQIYTVSYIVNVPGSQTAGTYTTTLTYICTPTF